LAKVTVCRHFMSFVTIKENKWILLTEEQGKMSNMPIVSRCKIAGQVTIKENEILVWQRTETWKLKTRREMDNGAPAGRRCASEAYIQPLLIHGENFKSHTLKNKL